MNLVIWVFAGFTRKRHRPQTPGLQGEASRNAGGLICSRLTTKSAPGSG